MPFKMYTTSSGAGSLKKLPLSVRKHIFEKLQILQHYPHTGQQLHNELKFLRSLHLRWKKTDYRIAYEVDEKNKEISIWYAASRENFYKELRRIFS